VKLRTIGYFIITALATMLLVGCSALQSLSAGSGSDDTAATQIIDAYNVSRLLGQADNVLTRSLMDQLPDEVDADQRQRIRAAINSALRTSELTTDVRQRLVQQARSEGHERDLMAAATQLQSPLATRMLKLQSNAGQQGFADDYNAFMQQPLNARRKARLQQIRTLMQNMGIIDVQSAFQLTLLKAMVATRNAATSAAYNIDQATLQALVDNNRTTLRNQMQEQVPLILLYVYRDIDDDTLQSYVEMQSSPALVWVNQALVKAIQQTLAAAGQNIPGNI